MTKEKSKPEENENDAARFFDEENYSTIIVSSEENKEKSKAGIKDFITLLESEDPEHKVMALELIKKEKAFDFLLDSIVNSNSKQKKAMLIAACWESGLDFSDYFEFFLPYALDKDPFISLEALTVLESIAHVKQKETWQTGIDRMNEGIKAGHDNAGIMEDVKIYFYERIKAFDNPDYYYTGESGEKS